MKKPTPPQYTLDGIPESIVKLDLSMVIRKIKEPEPEGRSWTDNEAREADLWYRRYLALILKYGESDTLVPNYYIDCLWHQHILDTKKYAKDCFDVFGYFLHHYPYFGLNGDASERDNAFEHTNLLYRIEFGEDCTQMFGGRTNLTGSPLRCRTCHPMQDKEVHFIGMGCNHAGSGTGCGQSGGRGR